MAEFPKHFDHVNPKLPNRVAHTPADEVNLVARGYKQIDVDAQAKTVEAEKAAAEKKADAEARKAAASTNRNS
jgi:hypothetical protein